jgi:regulator of sigma E protease
MASTIETILSAILLLGILVFLHELGHFIVAKLVGIRVETFSIGFPPRLFGKKIGDTDYCVSATPLGGYVKLAGMIDESLDKETIKGEPWEYQSKPVPHRMATILAGPLMNVLLTVFLLGALIYISGNPVVDGTKIGYLTKDFPAEQAGIQVGDRIVSLNGTAISSWEEMTDVIYAIPDKDLLVEWEHEGEILSATLHTRKQELPVDGEIREVGMIGIGAQHFMEKVGLFTAAKYGFERTVYLTKLIFSSLKRLISGRESLRSIGGPVMIAKIAGDSARSGWEAFLSFMAFLSLNLAIVNLLPIPALDGGHLFFLVIEGVTRKPLPFKARLALQKVGMLVLFTLIIFIVFNDVRNVFF